MSLIIAASLLATALAQTTTTTLTLPLYGLDATQSLAASVIDASPNATTLYLNCVPSPSDPEACAGFAYSRTLVTGPSTYLLEVHEPDLELTSTQDCVSSTAYAVCNEYATSGDSYHYDGVATYPAEMVTSFSIAVTAGMGKLVEAEATGTQSSAMSAATGESEASITPAATTTSAMMTASMTSDAASGTSTGAASARGVGKDMGVLAAVCAMGSLWL